MAEKKSETRIAFEKAFAAARKAHGGDGGVFTFRGKKYTTDYAKPKVNTNDSDHSDEEHNFDYSPDSDHMKKHHTFNKSKTKKYKPKKKNSYSKTFNYSKKKLGGFRDESFLEGPTPTLFED